MDIAFTITPIMVPIALTILQVLIFIFAAWSGCHSDDNYGGGFVEALVCAGMVIAFLATWITYAAVVFLS